MVSFFASAMVTSSSRSPSFDPNFITYHHLSSSSFDPQASASNSLSLAVIALCANMAAARACSFQISNCALIYTVPCRKGQGSIQFNSIQIYSPQKEPSKFNLKSQMTGQL